MNFLGNIQKAQELVNSQSIGSLIGNCEADWGDAEDNIRKVVRTGVRTLDNIIYGFEAGLTGIMGSSGSRKSTFIANAVLYNAVSKNVEDKLPQVILTAESGMTPERYRDMLIAMRATQYLNYWRDIGKVEYRDTVGSFFTDYFRYYTPNEIERRAIELSMKDLSNSPLFILGSGERGGVDKITNYHDIFQIITDEIGYSAVYIDHIHSIYAPGIQGDYAVLNEIVPVLANCVKTHNLPVIAASQVSLGSVRSDSMEARGGTRLREECSLYFGVTYNRVPSHNIELHIDKSRVSSDKIRLQIPIDEVSGLFTGDAVIVSGSNNSGSNDNNSMFGEQQELLF